MQAGGLWQLFASTEFKSKNTTITSLQLIPVGPKDGRAATPKTLLVHHVMIDFPQLSRAQLCPKDVYTEINA